MEKRIIFYLGVIVLTGLVCGCETKTEISDFEKNEKNINLEEIKNTLEGNKLFNREEPFHKRKFKPFLADKWIGNAVSYGCYREGQAPGGKGPSKMQILEDLKILSKHWSLIRVYNADDDTEHILEVIKKNNFSIKVMLGIWLAGENNHPQQKIKNTENVLRGIELVNKFKDIIIAVNVGNEAQVFWSGHKMDMNKQIRYVRALRNNTTVPVTIADDYHFWNKPEGLEISKEIDFIVTHIYPLWNGKTLKEAIPWMDSTYRDIQNRHPQMDIVLGETGWATAYNPFKKGAGEQGTLIKGKVSLRAQEQYLLMYNEWVIKNKITAFLFEAFDEPWKGGGKNSDPSEIEKHWGVFNENRTPKKSFRRYINNIK
jgi:exo-beta-1,3-glucanase (GH17 family)